MRELEDWLICDPRRSAIILRANERGIQKWCCILHDFMNWQVSEKDFPGEVRKTYPVVKTCYHEDFEKAILGAIRQ
jgi:hypothetical protein